MSPRAVDVLRGLREVCANLAAHFAEEDPERAMAHQQEVDALAAVAGLIEATAEEYRADTAYAESISAPSRNQTWTAVVAARKRRRTALARCGGAA